MNMPNKQIPNLDNKLRGLRDAMGEMLQGFRELHGPIRESQEKMPEASRQLRRINDETEAATVRVLDVAEAICSRDTTLIERLQAVMDEVQKGAMAEVVEKIASCRDLADQNQNDTFAIMEALQFQDITSQQLAQTMDLLQDIEARMNILLEMMGGKADPQGPPGTVRKDNTVDDPQAKCAVGHGGQADVDSLISSLQAKS